MNINDIEGKTIKEIEEQLSSQKNYTPLLVFIAVIVSVLIFVILWNIGQNYYQIKKKNAQLVSENIALKKELSVLKEQLSTIKKETPLPKVEPQKDYILHEIKANDNLGVISKQYYGVSDYASDLAKLNGLTVNSTLQIGQIIIVPENPDIFKEKKRP